jgi:hypothetical protein
VKDKDRNEEWEQEKKIYATFQFSFIPGNLFYSVTREDTGEMCDVSISKEEDELTRYPFKGDINFAWHLLVDIIVNGLVAEKRFFPVYYYDGDLLYRLRDDPWTIESLNPARQH